MLLQTLTSTFLRMPACILPQHIQQGHANAALPKLIAEKYNVVWRECPTLQQGQ